MTDEEYYAEVKKSLGRGAPTALLGTSTKALKRGLAKLRGVPGPDAVSLVTALRKVKQDEFNMMVEGNGRQPADVVDSVVYAIRDYLPADVQARLYAEVVSFYPDYVPEPESS